MGLCPSRQAAGLLFFGVGRGAILPADKAKREAKAAKQGPQNMGRQVARWAGKGRQTRSKGGVWAHGGYGAIVATKQDDISTDIYKMTI